MWHSFLREMNVKAGCEVYRNAVKEPKVADDLVPYCFRHSFATDLKDANIHSGYGRSFWDTQTAL